MQNVKLDHVNIRSPNISDLVNFYYNVCGFEAKEVLGSAKKTFWIGCEGRVFIHIVECFEIEFTNPPRIEHFSFRASGLRELVGRLQSHGIGHRISHESDCIRVNLHDPDGNRLHCDFELGESAS